MTAAESSDPLVELQLRQHGVFTFAQAVALGWTGSAVKTQVRRGLWLRLGSGGYCLNDQPSLGDLELRRAAARLRTVEGDVLASHATAGIIYGFPYLEPPGSPTLTRHRVGTARSLHNVLIAEVGAAHRWRTSGVPILSPARTVVDLARTAPDRYAAQALVDGALRFAVDRAAIAEVLAFCAGWPGVAMARAAIAFVETLCASPLESRARVWFAAAGLPLPECQVSIGRDRVDFCWREQKVVVECDGRLKYDDPWRTGDVLWEEKRREDRLRGEGFTVLRAVWADGADGGVAFCRRVAAALGL